MGLVQGVPIKVPGSMKLVAAKLPEATAGIASATLTVGSGASAVETVAAEGVCGDRKATVGSGEPSAGSDGVAAGSSLEQETIVAINNTIPNTIR